MDRATRAAGLACAWLFVLSAVLSAYEVGMRYLFAAPSNWVQELVTTLCAIGFAFGGAWTMLEERHIRITIVPDRLGPAGQRAVAWLSAIVGTFYLAGLLWGVWLQGVDSIWRFGDGVWQPELMPGPPNWALPAIVKGALVGAVALFLLLVVRSLLRLGAGRD